MDAVTETINTFRDKISIAKLEGEEWVETTPEIIRYFNRSGLGKVHGKEAKYFVYDGIKVCENGKKDEIIKEEAVQRGQLMHGASECVIEGFKD